MWCDSMIDSYILPQQPDVLLCFYYKHSNNSANHRRKNEFTKYTFLLAKGISYIYRGKRFNVYFKNL